MAGSRVPGMTPAAIPDWGLAILATAEDDRPARLEGGSVFTGDRRIAALDHGVVRFDLAATDSSIDFYRAVGGAHMHERASVSFAMTTLDTPVYHGYLAELRPAGPDAIIVDVGAGDGRNALPWLGWGATRVVLIDPVAAALARFRERIAADHPEWLDRVLLVEADARQLPLRSGCADVVQAVEALAYLNEDYSIGLGECRRLMKSEARLFIGERDYEAGLLTRLFYGGGIAGMLEQAGRRDILDGNAERAVRSRCFTTAEIEAMVRSAGLRVVSNRGISALSLILGYERSAGHLKPEDEARVAAVRELLSELGRSGGMRRSHAIVAALA